MSTTETDKSEFVTIKIFDPCEWFCPSHSELHRNGCNVKTNAYIFRLRKTSSIAKLKAKYLYHLTMVRKRVQLPPGAPPLRFLHNGRCLESDATPESVGMQDDDQIDVFVGTYCCARDYYPGELFDDSDGEENKGEKWRCFTRYEFETDPIEESTTNTTSTSENDERFPNRLPVHWEGRLRYTTNNTTTNMKGAIESSDRTELASNDKPK